MKPLQSPQHHDEQASDTALFTAIAALHNASEAAQFFQDLCTPTELQAMADRWKVVTPIKQGVPYRKIHELTGVSVTTIGRIARYIAHGTGGYNLIFERLQKYHATKKR